MTINPTNNPTPTEVDYKTLKTLEACVRRSVTSADNESPMAETPLGAFQRLLRVYKDLRPLLTFLATFPLVPTVVRTGINILIQVLDSVIAGGPKIVAMFKAGRDLEPEPAG